VAFSQAVTPHFIDHRAGVMVFTSSGGIEGTAMMAHYTAAKHGVLGLMRAVALELGTHDIRVNAQPQAVGAGDAVVASLDTGRTRTLPADTVILVSFHEARRERAAELEGRVPVVIVGDAEALRDLLTSIHERHLAGLAA
jgi:NAD(P)-dependent dehydrogenase (short-subunit alcohol dehydrogenase family)